MTNSVQIYDNLLRANPLVSVIILNYNGFRHLGRGLKECLDSILETDYPNFEVIFVDNGSTDASLDSVQRDFGSKIKIVKNEYNLGFSEGFDKGIEVSEGKYIALLSNDMTVDRNWLKNTVRLMEKEPKIGLTGFKRLVNGTKNCIDGIGGNLYLCGRGRPVGAGEVDNGQYDVLKEDLDYIGGAMVLRRKTLQEVGLFDPDYFIFYEDVDLCFRIRKCSYRTVYVPDAIVWHRGQVTLKGMDPKGLYLEYMSCRSRVRFILIHFALIRLLSAFLIDFVWFIMAKVESKKLLVKAYLWNLCNMGTTAKKRLRYGRSSSALDCKYPVTAFRLPDLLRRVQEVTSFHQSKS